MVPPASWIRPSMPPPTTQLEKIQLLREVVDLNIQRILHPQNPAEQDVGKMIEKVDKLREWARRRMQQIKQLPDPQQEEGQQAPPMRLGRQPQNVWQEKEGRLHLGRAPTRGKKRRAGTGKRKRSAAGSRAPAGRHEGQHDFWMAAFSRPLAAAR